MKAMTLLLLLAGIPLWESRGESRASSAQQTIGDRSGKRVEWTREQSARDEAMRAVRLLLRRRLTPESAAQVALLNNQSLQATFEEIGISEADLVEAGLLKNPSFDGVARFPIDAGAVTDFEGTLAQDFLELAMRPLRKRLAKRQLEEAQLRVASEAIQLIAETKIAFYEMEAEQQLIGRLRLIGETTSSALESAQKQHEAGNIADLELANQQAGYSQSRLDIAVAEATLRQKREKLNRTMGVWGAETDWKSRGELPALPAREADISGLETLAIEQRYDLAEAEAQLETQVQALGLTKSYRYAGALELGVSAKRDTDSVRALGPSLRFELPIFNQGQGRIARGEAQLRQSERRVEALAVAIRSEVREHRDEMISKRDAALFYRDELLPERLRILNLTQLNYNAMFTGIYDLLLAKQRELDAERGFVEATRDYWIARAETERACAGSLKRPAATKRMQSSGKESEWRSPRGAEPTQHKH